MIEWFKAHPLAAGLIVFGVGLIFVLALFGGSSNSAESAVVTDAPSDVGANSALVAAQLNAGAQIASAQINANVQMAAIDAAKSIQNKQTDTQALAITTAADTSKYISTLQAQNDAASIDAAKAINAASLSTAQQVATIQAGANTTIATLQAQVANNNTDAQLKYGLASLDAAKYINDKNNAYKLTINQNILNSDNWQNIHAIDNASAVNSYMIALGMQPTMSASANLIKRPLVQ